jgi:hypothetical protein
MEVLMSNNNNNLNYDNFKTILTEASSSNSSGVLDLGVPIHRTNAAPLDLSSIIYLPAENYKSEEEFRAAARNWLAQDENQNKTWYPGQCIAVIGKINEVSHVLPFILQPQDHQHTDYDTADGAVEITDTNHKTIAQELVYKPTTDLIKADLKQLRNQIGNLTAVMNFKGVVETLGTEGYVPGDIVLVKRQDGKTDPDLGLDNMEYVYTQDGWVELGFGTNLIEFIGGEDGLQLPDSLVGGTKTTVDTLLDYIQASDAELASKLGILNEGRFSVPTTAINFKVTEGSVQSLVDYIQYADNTLAKFILGANTTTLTLPKKLSLGAATPENAKTLIDYIQAGDIEISKFLGTFSETENKNKVPPLLPTNKSHEAETLLDYITASDAALKNAQENGDNELQKDLGALEVELEKAKENISSLADDLALEMAERESQDADTFRKLTADYKSADDMLAHELTNKFNNKISDLQVKDSQLDSAIEKERQERAAKIAALSAVDADLAEAIDQEKQTRAVIDQEIKDSVASARTEMQQQDAAHKASLEAAKAELASSLDQAKNSLANEIQAYNADLQATKVNHTEDFAATQKSINQINQSLSFFATQAEVSTDISNLNARLDDLNASYIAEEATRADEDNAIRDIIGSGFSTSQTVAKKIDDNFLTLLMDATAKAESAKTSAIATAESKDETRATAAAQALTETADSLTTQINEAAQASKEYTDAQVNAETTRAENIEADLTSRLETIEVFFDGAYNEEGKPLTAALDTLQEIQDYIDTHGQAAAKMVSDIATNAENLTKAQAKLSSDINSAKAELTTNLETAEAELTNLYETGMAELTATHEQDIADLTEDLETAKSELTEDLETAKTTLTENLAGTKQELTEDIAELSQDLQEAIEELEAADTQLNAALGLPSGTTYFTADNSVYNNVIFQENLTLTYKFGKYEPDASGSFTLPCAGKNIQEVLLDAFAQEIYEGLIISTPSATFTVVSGGGSDEVGKTHGSPKVKLDLTITGSYKYGAKNANKETASPDIKATQAEIKYNNAVVAQMNAEKPNDDITYEHSLSGDALIYQDGTDTYKFFAYAKSGEDANRPLTNLGNFVGQDADGNYFGTKDFSLATGQIEAKTLLNAKEVKIEYTGYRKMFMGTVGSEPTEVNSAFIRSLNKISEKAAKSTKTFTVAAGQKSFYVAIPTSLTTTMPTFNYKFFGEWKALAGVTTLGETVDVEGANSFSAVPYKVYRYMPESGAFDSATEIQVIVK